VSVLGDIWNVCWRELKRFRRQPARILMSIVQPIIWLVLLGNMMQAIGNMPGFPTKNYLDFMAPGIVVMTTIFGGVFGGLSIVWDRRLGFLNKMLAAPISRSAIPIGKMIASGLISSLQAALILFAAIAMGANVATGPLGVVAVILIAMILCLMLSGISLALGAIIKSQETLMVVMNFLTMPLMFTSNSIFPLDLMPEWLKAIAKVNPITHTIDPIRTITTQGWYWDIILPNVAVIIALTLVVMTIATLLFRRSIS
jgi:ABC-2 type transport system permease protein